MASFLLSHHHEPDACRFAFAAWRGFASPLRHEQALASCAWGGHEMWWVADADDEQAALALLPPYVAARATALRVSRVPVP